MSVFFVSDLHLGHKRILEFTADVPGAFRGGSTPEEHDEWVIERCLSVSPNKRTVWYILGDVAMDPTRLELVDRLPGRKHLVAGNHDEYKTELYLEHFESVIGGIKRYGFWLTHMPLHEAELRGRSNVHGHMHHNELAEDPRYLNCCIEWLPDNRPISLDEVRSILPVPPKKPSDNPRDRSAA